MTVENKIEKVDVISCGAIIIEEFDENKHILLIKQFKNSDSWGIPKGHVELGESLSDCALREVKEETGISVSVHEKIDEVIFDLGTKKKKVIVFSGSVSDKKLSKTIDLSHTNNEVDDARWFNIKNLPKLVSYQSHMIRKYLETLDI